MAELERARAAKARLRSDLSDRPGVCGVGITHGRDGYEVRVNLQHESDRAGVPGHVDGVPVDVRVSGPVRAGG